MDPTSSAEVARELHAVLFGTTAELTGPRLAELTDTDLERDRALWRALGFPVAADDAMRYSGDDVAALESLDRLIGTGLVDDEVAIRLTRAMGRALAGVARSQAEVVEQLAVTAKTDPEDVLRSFAHVVPDIEALLVFVWRRHLVAALAEVLASDEPGDVSTLAVGFVDVTGYTAMSRTHPPAVVRHVIRTFESRVTDTVASYGGRVVSTLGDAVLFTVPDCVTAARLGLDLARLPVGDDDLPPVRVGLAWGEVVAHHGDVLGSVVNLAARLCEIARPGTVLIDRDGAALLHGTPDLAVRRIGRTSVRGYAHLEPWAVRAVT
ncbi:MAG TPA: adenylate/guanylate cyclase domain-containing protein [Mycobacteriales bacterium]|nr:adenylate/guanylate cyclase domain-containing protein [Mycobacteriales bacterium]